MEFELLKDVIIIFALSILVIYVFNRFKLHSIIGFLITGIITGPHGLGLIKNLHDVEVLAEIGIVLLLFTIGIEFSVRNLIKAKKAVLIGGILQVGIVIILTAIIAKFAGASLNESVFIGFLIALSSTAIVLRIIQNRGELGTFHGQTTMSILIFQDIIIVPMILFTPLLAGESDSTGQSILVIAVKGIGFIIFTIIAAKFIVPKILHQIARTQNRELFLLTVLVIGFATAWLTYNIGMSLALGAFIAGLIISESEYSEQAFGNIIPFRDLFISFFFVSVGMLLDLNFVIDHVLLVIIAALGLMLLKAIVTGFVAFILGYPFKSTLIVGLALSQVGEFSFVLSEVGVKYGLLSEFNNQLFLASAVITLSLTPFVINFAPKLAEYILKFPLPEKVRCGLSNLPEVKDVSMRDHLIIIGYGINGRNVARAAKYANIPHVIIEMNPDTVKEENAKGEIIYYGDATQETILQHSGIKKANILVVTIPNPADARLITQRARELNPHLYIIIRTRFLLDMPLLHELGANEVIPEEFETSVEIFSRVLHKYLIPHEEIEKLVKEIRTDEYKMFRSLSISEDKEIKIATPPAIPDVHSIALSKNSHLTGKLIRDCPFEKHNLALVAISRDSNLMAHPENTLSFQENDILFFLGTSENFDKFYEELD
ncbi:MAG: cation:proton antiporter [Bacteroidetes bacterium]|nr:cation:proton antiporter [Bacteroidota bacterium]